MRKIYLLIIILTFIPIISNAQRVLDGNRIRADFLPSGIFNQDSSLTNLPGFEWPKNTINVHAIFSSGLTIAAKVNGDLRMSACSYKGEYLPGYSLNGVAFTNSAFKVYKVSRGDNSGSNPDYAQWGQMVPYGAPYVDVNSNGIFELGIDTPGVSGAIQTIFASYTDGFTFTHNSNEGFGGGTSPLFSELHMTAWCYEDSSLIDVQFIKWDIINRSGSAWNEVYFSLFCDGNLGNPADDYIGCDPSLGIGYTYNSTNSDGSGGAGTYGANPPAVGITYLKTPKKNTGEEYGLTSFGMYNNSTSIACETSTTIPVEALNYMKGFKKDGTPWVNPTNMTTTKFIFNGNPESGAGWTEADGRIFNCNGDTTGTVVPGVAGNRKFLMNTGDVSLNIANNASTQIVIAQHINRGTNNLNSATRLLPQLNIIRNFWHTIGISPISSEIPASFRLEQNYPNPFNPSTKIRFDIPKGNQLVKLTVYDIAGKEVARLINQELSAGVYEYEFNGASLSSGMYFYRLEAGNFIETKKMILIK